MLTFCDQLKTNLLQNNTIFGNNGFYFRDRYEFISSGVSDRYAAMFYIRPIQDGIGKYKVRSGDSYDQIQFDCRLVAQIPNGIDKDNAIQSLLAQVSENTETEIISFSDDTDGIYQTEYRKEAVTRDFYLLSIDFRVTEGATLTSGFCDPICFPEPVIQYDFEGEITVGEFEAEGGVWEYGFRAGWGDDYGTLPDLPEFENQSGCFWIDGILYVWGVDVDSIIICETEFSGGTFLNDMTTFAIENNPFPEAGETCEIKLILS